MTTLRSETGTQGEGTLHVADRELDRSVLSVWGHLMPDLPLTVRSRERRGQRIREALLVDGVLTRSQLERYFGADDEDLDGLHLVTHVIEPVHMRSTLVETTFVGLSPQSVRARPSILAHAVGTAQGRLQCVIDPQNWQSVVDAPSDDAIAPDAVFTTATGQRVAVEYDRGTYSASKVVAKLTDFAAHYDGTLWMVPPPVYTRSGAEPQRNRRAFLQAMIASRPELARVRKPIHIMLAKWWTGDRIIRE
ncbi:replication-relaxation family protein [Deinococcus sp. 14RED07]|uniref:replication-relaxation family protein n=1 Tax=Deinococcus sp. 14RED07 TaxID=2745874 RepID=UPI001E392129|nr:replication-relaxation family protein [Deinococcus sp. 14RED07]MCD0176746.1 replication-relaxation family protein [Deinococcus sp. 14RED07]